MIQGTLDNIETKLPCLSSKVRLFDNISKFSGGSDLRSEGGPTAGMLAGEGGEGDWVGVGCPTALLFWISQGLRAMPTSITVSLWWCS